MFVWENIILIFNLTELENQAGNDSIKFLWLLKTWFLRKSCIPKQKDPYRLLAPLWGGSSFLLEPEYILIKDTNTDPDFKVQYIKLAGRRDLHLYKTYKLITLPLSYYSDINLNLINYNPLLHIKDNNLHFKYEEYNGT